MTLATTAHVALHLLLDEADLAALEVYRATGTMAVRERDRLGSEIREAAVSVVSVLTDERPPLPPADLPWAWSAEQAVSRCQYLLGLAGRLGALDLDQCQALICRYAALASSIRSHGVRAHTVPAQHT